MTATPRHSSHPERRSWAALALLCVAQFMVVLDITIVNVALPSIGRALDFAPSDLQWVVTSYVICSGGLLLIGGRAGDLLGRRRVFLGGLLLFTAASLASGLAPSAEFLVASRALQGVGAALLTPSALSIVTSTYSGSQRATAMTIWGAIASAGVGVGVIAGGMLTSWLSWEWVFLVNVPVGLAAVALTPRVIPDVPRLPGGRPLDGPGALAVVAGLAVLVYALAGVPDHGWGSGRTLALLALSAVLLAAFAAVERRAARPLLPPDTWRMRSLASGAALMLGATGLVAGTFYLNSVYLQSVLGWSPLETGLGFLPFVAATAAGVHGASHLLPRLGTRKLVAGGMALVSVASLELALAPDHAGYAAYLLPGVVVLGFGLGLVFPAVQITAMSEVDHERAGIASGLMQTSHEVGAAVGIAVLSAVAVSGGGASFGAGYGDGFLVAAISAALLGLLAAVSVRSVRPAAGARVALH
jgi:EmrB/QacA subfamily drug resistance transporter